MSDTQEAIRRLKSHALVLRHLLQRSGADLGELDGIIKHARKDGKDPFHVMIGRMGGLTNKGRSIKSEAKAEASRRNGKLGGRPRLSPKGPG